MITYRWGQNWNSVIKLLKHTLEVLATFHQDKKKIVNLPQNIHSIFLLRPFTLENTYFWFDIFNIKQFEKVNKFGKTV